MKITITQIRELSSGRIVKPGDVLESPKDGSEEQLQAYVDNGIATISEREKVKSEKIEDGRL